MRRAGHSCIATSTAHQPELDLNAAPEHGTKQFTSTPHDAPNPLHEAFEQAEPEEPTADPFAQFRPGATVEPDDAETGTQKLPEADCLGKDEESLEVADFSPTALLSKEQQRTDVVVSSALCITADSLRRHISRHPDLYQPGLHYYFTTDSAVNAPTRNIRIWTDLGLRQLIIKLRPQQTIAYLMHTTERLHATF